MPNDKKRLKLGAASPKQQKIVDAFIADTEVIVIGGAMGGGKSYLMTLLTTLLMDDPKTRVCMFREYLNQLEGSGGLVDTAKSIYSQISEDIKVKFTANPNRMRVMEGSGAGDVPGDGARIEFRPLETDADIEKIRGLQYTMIGVDEGTAFSKKQIEFMISRLRSESSYSSRMVISCNPDPDHFLCDMIKDYYLDEEGNPLDSRAGDIRYFLQVEDTYHWGSSKEEVLVTAGKDINKDNLLLVKSFTFIGVTIDDNPPLMAANPSYKANLENLPRVERLRNLIGNWFAREESKGVFKRQWLLGENGERAISAKDVPRDCIAVRGIDKAHTPVSEKNTSPDFTAMSPLVLKDSAGFYYLLGNYHESFVDTPDRHRPKPEIGRIRKRAGERDSLVVKQMLLDKNMMDSYGYREPKLVLAKDSGAGDGDFKATVSKMVEHSIKVIKDKTISNVPGKKMKDFLGFTNACENGLVFIVTDTFHENTLLSMLKEWEIFEGEGSTRTRKDDWVDSISMAFNAISSVKKSYRTVPINRQVSGTLSYNKLKRERH